ncbi:MAG: B12-binding domain-containing protein, partial [Bacteroidota bacterium]
MPEKWKGSREKGMNGFNFSLRLYLRLTINDVRIGLDEALQVALDTPYEPLQIINTFLLDGMKVVGEL